MKRQLPKWIWDHLHMQAGSQAGLEGRHPLDIPHIV